LRRHSIDRKPLGSARSLLPLCVYVINYFY
jgi:hypothetical protein